MSTLVDSVVKVAPLVVNHQGQFPSVTISFNLAPGAAIGQAVAGIQGIDKDLHPPLSLQTSFQGNAQAFGSSLKSTPILILASLFVIYLILGILYESIIHPITIISTLPSAGVGALLLLMAAHFDLSVIAIVGIILLIGIVKKNGIMLVDFALHAEQNEGLTTEKAIYQACITRFRPILMTTMAALLGAVPMMVGNRRRLRDPPTAPVTRSWAGSRCRKCSLFIRHRSSISISIACRIGCSATNMARLPQLRPNQPNNRLRRVLRLAA